MSAISDNQMLESFVPIYDVVPDKWEVARPFLVEQLSKPKKVTLGGIQRGVEGITGASATVQ